MAKMMVIKNENAAQIGNPKNECSDDSKKNQGTDKNRMTNKVRYILILFMNTFIYKLEICR